MRTENEMGTDLFFFKELNHPPLYSDAFSGGARPGRAFYFEGDGGEGEFQQSCPIGWG